MTSISVEDAMMIDALMSKLCDRLDALTEEVRELRKEVAVLNDIEEHMDVLRAIASRF